MPLKIISFATLVAFTIFVNSAFDNLIDPTAAGVIAANQVENSEQAAVVMRGYTTFAQNVPVYTWAGTILTGFVLFYYDLKKLLR